jgi:ABC-type branched-subunit amino acid transport system permease subunit
MVYGALLVVVITFLPGGLVGAWRRIFRQWQQWRPWRPRQA